MPTLHRFSFLCMLAAIVAASPARGEGGSLEANWAGSHRVRFTLLAEIGSNDRDTMYRLERGPPPVLSADVARTAERRRLKLQVMNLLTVDDRLELGRAPDRPLTKRLLAPSEPMWSAARNPAGGRLAARVQLAYHLGQWGVALGSSPDLRDGRLQVRLSYALRY
jgi:hypothetical protein